MKVLLEALVHLHSKQICHKDIKPENIIINQTEDGLVQLKLIDFNVSEQISPTSFVKLEGTKAFMAPEVIRNQKCNLNSDLWGVGCILSYLLTGKMPINDQSLDFSNQNYDFVELEQNEEFGTLDAQSQDLLKKLLTSKLEDRLSAQEALSHPWFDWTF